MKSSVRIFPSPAELAARLGEEIVRRISISATRERIYSIALSGGSTPELLYSFLAEEYSDSVPWEFVYIFWGDERCVPLNHADSNYGMVRRILLDKIGIPAENVFRMKGEDNPVLEAARYSCEISSILPSRDGLPVFDLVLLGLGKDGHTASIFPGNLRLLTADIVCGIAEHPVTKQKRITISGRAINNAEAVVFLASGKDKAQVVRDILGNNPGSDNYPASHIQPVYGSLDWFLDTEAGALL